MRRRLSCTAVLFAAMLPPVSIAADFLGPQSCRACHPEAYAAWKQSKHSRALASLSPQQQTQARCQSCHAPNAVDQNVSDISCETCHGGGQYYAADYVMKDPELDRLVGLLDPSEKSCRNCHDASSPSLAPFDFVQKLKQIDHWSAERSKRTSESGTRSQKK